MLGTSMFLSGVTFATTLPYAAIVGIEKLGMSNATYAALVSAGAAVGAVTSLLIGYVSDRVPDRRILVLVSSLAGVIGYGLIYLFRNQMSFSIATVFIIPLAVAIFSQSFSFVRAFYSERAPGRADMMVSVMRTIFSASWVVVPPAAGIIAALTSVFDVYLITCLAYLAIGTIFILMMRNPATRVARPAPKSAAGPTQGRTLDAGTLCGLLAILIVMIAMRLVQLAMPLMIVNDLGGSISDVGLYAGTAALTEIPFMLLWGYAVGRYFSKVAIIAFSAALLGVYILLVLRAATVMDVLILQVVNGVAASALLSINISYVQDTIKGRIGLSSSLMDVIAILATLGGAALFGTLSAGSDYRQVLWAAAAIAILGGVVMGVGNFGRIRLRRSTASP
ncbi:MFS transporter [Devosia nitrariae]|uniref:MFS transporter n=2 Tax=Devosia nitrariae TaxID=2071872 RepID=A0ABQ5W2B4_9HYPH|nr:MFS transporter [Devosia nitrariae]